MHSLTNFRTWGIAIFILFNLQLKNATAQYTLQDDDVQISGGIITACIYNFAEKDIIIPETLHGQTVIGIADASAYNTGAFYNKGITSISFPQSIQFIGSNSFRTNAISNIDLSNLPQLEEIRTAAFIQNTATSVDLSNCSSLLSIGNSAFQICDIISINFTGCSALQTIGEQAFYDNEISGLDFSPLSELISIGVRAFFNNSISSVNFNNCTSLQMIDHYAFTHNSLSNIDITPCTGLLEIGPSAFTYNSITSFVLPVVTGYEENGWRNSSNQVFAGGDVTTNLTASYFVPVPYTLTDADVVVTDGVLTSCSYNFASKDIIIPDTLDGQAVTELKGGASANNGVFYNKGIISVVLPSALEVIGQYAFYGNSVRKLDLSKCPSIREIQDRSFYRNGTINLNLNGCSVLESIGDYAFYGCSIDTLDFSTCPALKTIGLQAFYQQPKKSLTLLGCSSLERIYDQAFYYHSATSADLSGCSSLIYIGSNAIYGNSISSFVLPTPGGYESLGWRDSNGDMHSARETITNLNLHYKVPIPYTLTDEDVVVTDSIITSCSYDFFFTDIIIPDTLDGQIVTGIADGTSSSSVFKSKNITTLQLPAGLKSIGDYSFNYNKITEVNLSVCSGLQTIGKYAFYSNALSAINLSTNNELIDIGNFAFAGYYDGTKNNISSLDLSNCPKLESIGSYAFSDNSISSIDFSNCINLKTIGDYAFLRNALSSLDITNCTSLLAIGTQSFNSNSISNFVLPIVTGYESYGWRDGNGSLYTGGQTASNLTTYYKVPIPYTLTNDDVVVTNGEITSCSYNFASKDIIIPDTLDGQAVTGIADGGYSTGVFTGKGLFTVQFPSTLEKTGVYAFRDNNLTSLDFTNTSIQIIGDNAFRDNNLDYIDFSNQDLKSIGNYAFQYNDIDSIDFAGCSSLQTIGSGAFVRNDLLTVDFASCLSLKTIGNNSFENNYSLSEIKLSGCDSLKTIGNNAFNNCALTELNFSFCPELITIGSGAFKNNDISVLNLQNCNRLKTISSEAFYQNALSTIDLSVCDSLKTIGEGAFRSNSLSNVNISCPQLGTIGQFAFYTNNLSSLELSNCTSLTVIGRSAFAGNSLSDFILPYHTIYSSMGWRNGDNLILPAGTTVSLLTDFYEIPVPYTLTDDDAEVTNGIITSCSYNFVKKDIIIPDTLDGQAVMATFDAGNYGQGLFYNKGIKTIKFPSTIEKIGNYSLYYNPYMYKVDLSDCTKLMTIGNETFSNCSKLSELDFTSCSNLSTIGAKAFYRIGIDSLSFEGCTSLKSIGDNAFQSIDKLVSVDFTGCDSLESIGSRSFNSAYNLKSIDLSVCPRLTFINVYAFYGCGFSSFNLPSVVGFEQYSWRDGSNNSYPGGANVSDLTTWYKAAIPYTLTDDDVVVTNGEIVSCSYNFAQNDIIIPDTLDGQEVIGIADAAGYSSAAFYKKNVYTVKFPETIQKIGRNAFYDSNLKSLDFSNCPNLELISPWAFYSCPLSSISFNGCSNLRVIDQYAFRESSVSSVDFTGCIALTNIVEYSFYVNAISSLDLSDCTSLIKIGNRAFYGNNITGFVLPETNIPGYTLSYWKDDADNHYDGGDFISNLNTNYNAVLIQALLANFYVSDGLDPLSGVSIELHGYDTLLTDETGLAQFTVMTSDSIGYSAKMAGYLTVEDSIKAQDSVANEYIVMLSCSDSTWLYETICEGEIYTVGDSSYNESGIYTTIFTNQNECDSVVTLNLTVNPLNGITITDTICAGDQVYLGDTTYAETGTYMHTFTNQFGCDSIATLELTVHPADSVIINEIICEGDIFIAGDGTQLTDSGSYTYQTENQYGCDSLTTVNLTVLPATTELTEIICEGEEISIGSSVYTQSGIYADTLLNQLGCDSIIHLQLTVIPENTHLTTSICEKDSMVVGSSVYTQTGIYKDTLINQLGCDSIVTLDLTVNLSDSTHLEEIICDGEAVQIGDSVYTTSGNYTNTLINQFGCDSTVTLNLTVNPVDKFVTDQEICEGGSFLYREEFYDEQGTYCDTFINRYGCDSIYILNLSIFPDDRLVIHDTITHGETYDFRGMDLSSGGLYSDTLTNQFGCDSIISLLLNVYFEPVVYIPDIPFKTELLADTLINTNKDDEIQVSEANAYSGSLKVNGINIQSLTGIEAFGNIDSLNCSNNLLDTLDLTQNSKLVFVDCAENDLVLLDISNLGQLEVLYCSDNELAEIKTDSNDKLDEMVCENNNITNLDFSQNHNLTSLNCINNIPLSQLNLNNGNNTNLNVLATGNPNLFCVTVDNVEFSKNNWTGYFESVVIFSTDCLAPDIAVSNINYSHESVYPNDSITIYWEVINFGNADAVGGWNERISLVNEENQKLYLNGNLVYSNTLPALDTIKRSAKLKIPNITYFNGPAKIMAELIPTGELLSLETIIANNKLQSDSTVNVKEIMDFNITEASVFENYGGPIKGVVRRSGNSDTTLSITLSTISSDLNLPASVEIAAGSNAANFNFSIIDNDLFDGIRRAEIEANAAGLNPVSDRIEILDDEIPSLSISLDRDSCTEGESLTATISSDLKLDTVQTVLITNDKTGQLIFDSPVLIPAHDSIKQINIDVADDSNPELDQRNILRVSASGYLSGRDTLVVRDDDIPEIEIELLTDTISESAGENATWLQVKRSADNDETISVALSIDSSNEIEIPEYVHFFPGEMEKLADIDVLDNNVVDGFRSISITGAVYIPSCNCTSEITGTDTAPIVLADDDGPALKLSCDPVLLAEGQVDQGTLTITKNTPSDMTLLVHLTTNLPGELLLQDTVTIPAGSSSVEVPVYARNDSIEDGEQTVVIRASADEYSPGTITVYTSDQNKPDLSFRSFNISQTELPVSSVLEFNATLANSGFLKAPAGISVYMYLSADKKVDAGDVLLDSYTIEESIPIGDSVKMWELLTMPATVGDYYLILSVNPNETVSELLYTNNVSQAIRVKIQSAYTISAIVDEEAFTSAKAITIHGSAIMTDSSPAANKEVEVYVITQGIRRTVSATTDESGNYTAIFEPGENETGHYIVGACHPDEDLSVMQDDFNIMGFGRTSNDWLVWYLQKGETISGSFTIQNYSNAALTNLSLNLPSTPVGFEFSSNTISVLEGNGKATFNFSVSGNEVTKGLDYLQIPVEISSDQGVNYQFKALYFCQAKEGLLKTEPVSLESSFTKGKIRYIEFYVYNAGAGNSGEVTISLPDIDWMSMASSAVIENIAPGESSKVTLRLQSTQNTLLNYPMTGKIAINASNCDGLALPYHMECVSEETGNLLVDVVDEYTYNTEEGPHLANAHVNVSNPFTGEIVGEGYTNSNGLIEFTDIPEGEYILLVEAINHDGSRQGITINPGKTTEKLVFISFQAISYNWTVVPTEIEDEYQIELNIEFETNVPKPVVTLDIPPEMPVLETGETFSFMATLTNHGLITAEDLDLGFPADDAEYEFIFQDKKYNIPAKESLQIPVVMQRKVDLKSAGIPAIRSVSKEASGQHCYDVSDYEYGWQCGPNKKYEMYKKPFTYRRCDDNSNDDDGDDGGGTFPGDTDINTLLANVGRQTPVPVILGEMGMALPGLGGVAEVIAANSGTSGYDPTSTDAACEPCLTEIAKFAVGKLIPGAGLVLNASSCFDTYNKDDASEKEVFDCLLSMAPSAFKEELEKKLSLVGDINSLINIAITCYGDPPGMITKSASELKPDMPPLLKQAVQDLMYVELIMDAQTEWQDEFWGPVNWQTKENLSELAKEIEPFVNNHHKFSELNIREIKYALLNTDISPEEIDTFTTRWNNTIDAWNDDVFEPNNLYPDILDGSIAENYIEKTNTVNQYMESRGFLTVHELFDDAATVLNEQIEDHQNSVCASVKLSISQKLVMTREAFRGTLTLNNGHETSPIEEFELNLEIKNESGELCNDLFQIETESLLHLTALDGTGTLPAMESGTAVILFIPEKGAAPAVTQSYSFGGTISYLDPFTFNTVTKTLFPVTLEVHPSPDLYLHYFMQRDILGDDPLTVNITEPIIPGELALMIENNGYGDAENVRIESAQPKITDNEKGLLIDFQLVGSNLQGEPANLGLINIDFGTVPAQETRLGQWWFTSSLLGHFVNYEAKLTHLDSRDNPNLSLVSGAEMHELIKSISVYGALDDGISDFLVNDIQDIKETPDAIYLSQGNLVFDVYESTDGNFDQPVSAPAFTNTLSVSPQFSGWNYLKLDDPGNGKFKIAEITRNNDGTHIPLTNAWLTYITMPDGKEHIYENKFHIVDEFEDLTDQSYTIVWVPVDTDSLEVIEIKNVPEQTLTTPLQELTVVFNKEIDPATFTFEDVTLQLENGQNISNNSIVINPVNAYTYQLNIAALAIENGTYSLTLNTNNINDLTGSSGYNSKTISWSQYLTVPAIKEFSDAPSSVTNEVFNAVQIEFNMEIDATTLTGDNISLERNGIALPVTLSVQQMDESFIHFKITGISSALTEDAEYKLVIDLSSIRSLTGVYGIAKQFVEWQTDTTPPEIISLDELNSQKLDAQHVPGVQIVFSEPISEFTSTNFELRRGNTLLATPNITVRKVSESIYKLSGFETLTTKEGSYGLKILTEQINDLAGNAGVQPNSKNTHYWQVDRTPPPPVTDLRIEPDLGASDMDHITSGDISSISMVVNEDNTSISLFETNGSDNTLMYQSENVDSGPLVIPVQFSTSGQISTKIVCADSLENQSSVPFGIYRDNTDLQAEISGALLAETSAHPDSLLVEFSDDINQDDFTNTCLSLKYNAISISSENISINYIDKRRFSLKGLSNIPLNDGIYTLDINLKTIREDLSGRYGVSTAKTSWNVKVPNSYPVANAGEDAMVSQGQLYTLDGSASHDPDSDSLKFKWYAPKTIVLTEQNSVSPSFRVPYDAVGTNYEFMVAANDGELSNTDKVMLTIDKAVIENTIDTSICSNGFFVLGSRSLNVSGTYADTLIASNGSDSIIHLNLTVHPVDSVTLNESICEGDNYSMGNNDYDQSGQYTVTLTNRNGCDSIVTLNLTVNRIDRVTLNESICEGDTYSMGSNDYDQSGQYTVTLSNRNGCDSIVTLNLTVNRIDRVTLNESICEGDTYSMGNNDYDQSGQYTVTLSNRNGCDSIVTLNLTVNPTDALTIIDTIYQGESYSFNGANYTEAGIYTANLTNKLGCDSVVTLNLALIPNEQPQVLTQVVDMKIKIGDTLDVSIDLEGDIFYDSDDTLLDYNYEIENGNFVAWANFILNNGILEIDATPELSDTGCYEITIMAIDPFGQVAADTFNLCVVKNYTDISDFTVNKLNAVMYPNPTNGIVTVDFDRIINDKIEVYAISAAGDQVFKRRYFGPTEQITIDLSGKVSGIYFIVIQTENRKITKELIINEH